MSTTPVTTEGSEDAPGLLGMLVLKNHATTKAISIWLAWAVAWDHGDIQS